MAAYKIIAKLPIDSPQFGISIGLISGLIYWTGKSIHGNSWVTVDFTQTVTLMTAILGLVYLGALFNKWRLDDRWNTQHWFVRLQVLAAYLYGGGVLSILSFNSFIIVVLRK